MQCDHEHSFLSQLARMLVWIGLFLVVLYCIKWYGDKKKGKTPESFGDWLERVLFKRPPQPPGPPPTQGQVNP